MLFSLASCAGEKGKTENVEEGGRDGRANLNLEYSGDWPVYGPSKLRFSRWCFFHKLWLGGDGRCVCLLLLPSSS